YLPLYVFSLPKMAALMRQHPRHGGGKARTKRREAWSDLEPGQVQPFGFPNQPLPFILHFQKIRQQLERIINAGRWTHSARSNQPYPWRRFCQPYKETPFKTNVKWPCANRILPLSARNRLRHKGLNNASSGIQMEEAFCNRPLAGMWAFGKLFRRESADEGFGSNARLFDLLKKTLLGKTIRVSHT